MINLAFVMGFIGVATGIIIGILIYSNIDAAIDCPTEGDGVTACAKCKILRLDRNRDITRRIVLCIV